MPVILDPKAYDGWLDPGMTNVAAASELLKPFDARLMRRYPVSRGSITWLTTTKNVLDLWNLCPLRISYSRKHSMANDERMPRESGLIATIRKELPEVAKRARMTRNLCCFTKTPLPPTFKRTSTRSSARRSSTQVCVGKKCG